MVKTIQMDKAPFWMFTVVVCRDGFSFECQASKRHRCEPQDKSANNKGGMANYEELEVHCPSEPVAALLDYADDPDNPTKTAYGYVPVALLQNIIEQHGGLDREASVKEGLERAAAFFKSLGIELSPALH